MRGDLVDVRVAWRGFCLLTRPTTRTSSAQSDAVRLSGEQGSARRKHSIFTGRTCFVKCTVLFSAMRRLNLASSNSCQISLSHGGAG